MRVKIQVSNPQNLNSPLFNQKILTNLLTSGLQTRIFIAKENWRHCESLNFANGNLDLYKW